MKDQCIFAVYLLEAEMKETDILIFIFQQQTENNIKTYHAKNATTLLFSEFHNLFFASVTPRSTICSSISSVIFHVHLRFPFPSRGCATKPTRHIHSPSAFLLSPAVENVCGRSFAWLILITFLMYMHTHRNMYHSQLEVHKFICIWVMYASLHLSFQWNCFYSYGYNIPTNTSVHLTERKPWCLYGLNLYYTKNNSLVRLSAFFFFFFGFPLDIDLGVKRLN